jgi:molybdenum cofactor cytidylyltransferase
LLHDVERKSGRDHAEKGSALLLRMGYSVIADIVGAHMELPQSAIEKVDERAIVYLADKLTCGVKRVTVKTRLEAAMAKFGFNEEAANAARKRMADARTIMQRLGMDDADCLM